MKRLLLALWALLAWMSPAIADEAFATETTQHYEFEYAPELEARVRPLIAKAEAHHARIYGEVGVVASPDAPTRVTVLADRAEMLRVAAARHGGRAPPEWAAGLAYPATREIFLHVQVPPGELDTTFQHEISHVAVGELGTRVPRWFSEGLAIRQSEGVAMERIWLLTEAALVDAVHDLDELNRGFPISGARAGVAYAQAVHFVGWLQSEYGQARFQRLLEVIRDEGKTLPDAVAAVYPDDLRTIEQAWRGSLRVWWGWVPVIFGSTTLWGAATVLLVFGWRRRRRQRVARLRDMAATEAVEMAEDIEVAHGLEPPSNLHDPYDGRPPTVH